VSRGTLPARITATQDKLLQLFADGWGRDKAELIAEAIENHIFSLLDKHGTPVGYYPDEDGEVNE
jgi:predicted DNA-binding protein